MSHYPPDTDSLRSVYDSIRVDSVVVVKVGELASLTEMAVEHCSNSAVA